LSGEGGAASGNFPGREQSGRCLLQMDIDRDQ